VAGLHDAELVEKIGEILEIHPMVVDKITNTGQRAGFEDFEDYDVLTLKLIHLDESEQTIESEHIVFVLFKHLLVTFQENKNDPFEPIRERIKIETSRIRKANQGYLMFALIRTILHEYSRVTEFIGDKIENLEDAIFSQDSRELLAELNTYNTEIAYLNRIVRPAKEAIANLCRSEAVLINQGKSQFMINHILDSMFLVADAAENYRMMLHDHLSIYHTNVANKLNEMFRVLTIFSVIFVPLTFVAGIYGMNFEYIPELGYHNGYFVVWGVMIAVAAIMIVYFKKKGWL
jgi:magnesium transporter